MKKLLTLISFAFFINLSNAQIQTIDESKEEIIGEIKNLGSLSIRLTKKDNIIYFTYSDAKYKKITDFKTFSFEDMDNALEEFYKNIIKALETGEKITMKIPDGTIVAFPQKSFGMKSVQIGHSNSAGVTGLSQFLTKKQLDKLFGKVN